MKIDLVLASRGHPIRLMAVLTALDQLSSGDHDITYNVICDKDDSLTWKAAESLKIQRKIYIGDGPLAPRLNQAAMQAEGDAVSGAADDTFPLTQHWDSVIAAGTEQDHPAFSWQEVNDPTNQTMIVFSHKWLKAVGRMLPTYFPFWFGDTWAAEVYSLAFCAPMPIVENLQWGGKRGTTHGMRDLAFWFRFFAATRVERIAEARALCFAYGRPYEPPQVLVDDMGLRDAEQLQRVPRYEHVFGADQGEPSAQYLGMKDKAIEWLTEKGMA